MEIISDVWDKIVAGLILPLLDFNDPEKRLNYFYLLSSVLFAYYVYYKAKERIPFYKYILSKKVWLSKSAFIDYKYFFFNGILKVALVFPLLSYWRYLGVTINDWMEESFGLSSILLTESQIILYYTLALVILLDLRIYLVHLAMHKIPFLWEFHKIHHSATTLNPITQYRLHPITFHMSLYPVFLLVFLIISMQDQWISSLILK